MGFLASVHSLFLNVGLGRVFNSLPVSFSRFGQLEF